jgi:hypothetical protein
MKSFILNIAVYTLEQKEKDLVMTWSMFFIAKLNTVLL